MNTHGEYKTPGGKLIAVEFDVVNGEMRNVVVTGDFFLYPEEALPVLGNSLEGLPVSLGQAEYTEAIRAALDSRGELVGSSPEALAVAVARAVKSLSQAGQDNDRL